MAELNKDDFMEDAKGRLVPKSMVDEIDQERDSLVRELFTAAETLQKNMKEFKVRSMGDVSAFIDLSAEKYGVHLGGNKGNVSLISYDGTKKIQVAISEHISLDERLKAAKALIDECLTDWTEEGRDEIKVIVMDAFQVDKEGRLNVRQIIGLRRYEIDDEKWLRAMEAIGDSIQVVGSKSYIRFYERKFPEDKWRQVSMDLAAL